MAASASASSAAESGGSGPGIGFLIPNPTPTRGKALRIHVSPDGELFAYGAGAMVVLRSVDDPTRAYVYSEHKHDVQSAAFSPDGKLVASGDTSGEVRVWSVAEPGHPTRNVIMGLPGGVEDVAWDATGDLLGVTGNGKDRARIMTSDSGTDMGEMKALGKTGLAIAATADAPSCFAYGGEDKSVLLYEGRPSKLVASLSEHAGFVNAVAFSPDGKLLVTSGADKSILVRDAATGAVLSKTAGAHKSSVYSLAFSPDGASLASSSADKSVKFWSVAADGALAPAGQTVIGKSIPDMQNGLAWPKPSAALSVSLCSDLHVIDPAAPDAPKRTVQGPGGVITCLAAAGGGAVLTGDASGGACLWSRGEGGAGYAAARVGGDGHKKRVTCCSVEGGSFVTGAMDDCLCFGDVAGAAYSAKAKVGAQPKAVVLVPGGAGVACVATSKFTKTFSAASGAEVCSVPAPWEGRAVAASPDGASVFVGGEDGHVRAYAVAADGALTERAVTAEPLRGAVASLAVSPDGASLAVGAASKEVAVLSADSLEGIVRGKWTAHTSRVTTLAWSPSGDVLASAGVDQHVFFWSVGENHPIKRCNLALGAPARSLCWDTDGSAVWVGDSRGLVGQVSAAV